MQLPAGAEGKIQWVDGATTGSILGGPGHSHRLAPSIPHGLKHVAPFLETLNNAMFQRTSISTSVVGG